MAYVDLNPVRAGMTDDLATSDFTSVQQRLFDYAQEKVAQEKVKGAVKAKARPGRVEKTLSKQVERQRELEREMDLDELPKQPLMPFDGSSATDIAVALPFTREDYFQLVDTTGRAIRNDKRGSIAADLPGMVARLGINPDHWLDHIRQFGRRYAACAGNRASILAFSRHRNRRWGKGVGLAGAVYLDVA